MNKIIDLDIDGTLTGDTRISEIAMVEMPAIEQDFIYFSKQESYIVPQVVAQNACKARRYKDREGSSCGTPIGWTRSSQLCSRKPISLDTVKRMFSYLSRHRIDLVSSKSYDDGCGLLMYDAWGGLEALGWSKRIIQRAEKLSIDISNLPEYVNYPTGDTKNNMLIEDIGFIEKVAGEPKNEYISRCIEYHINKGYDEDQAAAICYSQAEEAFDCGCSQNMEIEPNPCWEGYEPIGLKPDGSPNCVPIKASKQKFNIDIYGYKPKDFDICPGAVETFLHLVDMKVDDETQGMIRSAAQIADNIFGIEKDVLETKSSTPEQLNQAKILLDDFEDLMGEIDKLVNMTHNVDYMKGHIRVIESYLPKQEDFNYVDIDGCQCISHTDEDGNEVYVPCETEPVEEMSFGIEEYSDEEKEAAFLLYELKKVDYQAFERIVGELRGASAAELRRRNHQNPTPYYLYKRVDNGEPHRDFCNSIENRYFTRFQIDLLTDKNKEFGHNRQSYSKWLYKGGPNCIHAWSRVIAVGPNIREVGMVPGTPGIPPKQLPNNGYYSEETKRRSQVAYIIEQKKRGNFASETEKRMIYGPLMIPNILIPRIDNGEKYFVRFKPETIEKMQQLYMLEKRLDKTNYEHSDTKLPSVVMVESWIINGEKDKAYELGYNSKDVPKGSWMGGFKVLDTPEGDKIWNDFVKTGKLKGFSVEGDFMLKFYRQEKDEYLLKDIINILNKINN